MPPDVDGRTSPAGRRESGGHGRKDRHDPHSSPNAVPWLGRETIGLFAEATGHGLIAGNEKHRARRNRLDIAERIEVQELHVAGERGTGCRLPRLCRNSRRRQRRFSPKGRTDQPIPIIFRCPNAFTAWRTLNARTDRAASALTALNPRVRNLPPPDIRLTVPNGCSTVQRLIFIRSGSAYMRASILSRAA